MDKIIENKTMSSLDIAELTGKPHRDLMKSIRKMEVAWIKINGGNFSLISYIDSRNRIKPMYSLSKTECLYIATKFNDEARAKLIIRWEELENQKTYSLPSNYIEALRLAADLEEERSLLEVKNQNQSEELIRQAPKVEYFNEVMTSQSTYTTNQIAKELGMSAIMLNRFLKDNRVQYKQNGTWLLYRIYQDKGFTKTKTHTYTGTNGETKSTMQTVWTEKGRVFIHSEINQRINQ